MRKRFQGRRTMRETLAGNNAAMRFFLGPEGSAAHPEVFATIKPRRTRSAAKPGRALEKHVLAAVLAALRSDPRVAMVERQQSGVFVEGNRHIRVGSRGALDVRGYLVGGKPFEIEVKRPGGRLTPEQSERIAGLVANGIIAGVATSAAEALALLP